MKSTQVFAATLVVIAALAEPRAAGAQEKPSPLVPLKLQLVISRSAGEKKISSMPYTLWVTANDNRNRTTSLRMGVEVPVPSILIPKEGAPTTSYNYRPVGTNIDCSATTEGNLFKVAITLNDSSVQFDAKESAASRPVPTGMAGAPAFRNFTSNFSILLKDGQTATYTSATDPVSGETLKVDVTLNVLK